MATGPADLPDDVIRVIGEYLQATDATTARSVLRRHPELLTDDYIATLHTLAQEYAEHGDPDGALIIQTRAEFLEQCRAVGVDAAFAGAAAHDEQAARGRVLLETAHHEDARWERERDPGALRRAARAWTELAAQLPGTHPLRAGAENEAATRLLRCYHETEHEPDLAEARGLLLRAVAGTAADDESFGLRLANLGSAWRSTFERTEDPADLRRALDAHERAVAATPPGADTPPPILAGLAIALRERYRLDGDAAALDRAVALDERALRSLPADAPDRPSVLNGLANGLELRHDRRGDPRDLDRLVAAREEALRLAGPATPSYTTTLNNLANAYAARARAGADPADFDRAITLAEQSIAATSPDSPGYAGALANLGAHLFDRYRQRGEPADLDRSIELKGQALERCRPDGAMWLSVAHDMDVGLLERFRCLGAYDDLEQAIATQQEVATRTPPSAAEASRRYETLGNALRARYLHTRRPADLDRAIGAYQGALALVPADGVPGVTLLNNLGSGLNDRFDVEGNEADLRRAQEYYTEALQHARPGTAEGRSARNNLGRALAARANRTTAEDDMRRAEDAFHAAADATPAATPEKLLYLGNLAGMQVLRHRVTGDEDARAAAVAGLRAIVADGPAVAPDQGLTAARSWGRLATERGDWAEAAEAYQAGLACLRLLYRRQGRRDQKEAWLGDAVGLAPGGAYALARSGDPRTAVVVAETGRAVLLSEALDRVGADLSALGRAGHAETAAQYRRAVNELAATDRTDDEGTAPRRPVAQLREAVDALVRRIQDVPGFEQFQRPPTFDAVVAAAGATPVVYVLATRAGGLALLVRDGRAEPVWLPELTEPALSQRLGEYLLAYNRQHAQPGEWRSVLLDTAGWLWPAVMGPVVAALAGHEHAVLVPMGPLGLLPLHAAWRADPSAATGRRYALDDLVLTYAPNARSLQYARRVPEATATDGILAVADPQPVPASPLLFAGSEADAALRRFPHGRRLAGPAATRAAVLAEMPHWPVLHFACHAYADAANPRNSALLLADGARVSLDDLLRAATFRPGLVVLSACETAIIGGDVPDEVVSLPSGFLQSGARGVIASFWPVYDASTARLMYRFYQLWPAEGTSPAQALRAAQQWLRDTPPESAAGFPVRDAVPRELSADDPAGHEHPVHWAAFSYVGG